MQVWNVLHAARWKYSTQKSAKTLQSAHHHITLSGCIFATKAHMDNTVNFSPLTAEIGSLVWGTPANFNRFRILQSLLHRHRSTEANWTLHDVWPSPGLVHYIYIFGGSGQNFARCKIHFASKFCALLYWQRYCTALKQWALAKLCSVVQGIEVLNFCRGCHLYLAGRPSRWALAHIPVNYVMKAYKCNI